jgi:hypothetical protein
MRYLIYEKKLENIRKRLAKIIEFDSIAVFNKLDRTNQNIISINDLKHFLRKNSIIIREDLIYLMVKNYSGKKESFSFEE